jgi:membrane protease YdiL (CAAX protease family)
MKKIRIQRILVFLFFTFFLSWGFDVVLIYFAGLDKYRTLGMNPWGMLAPAFVAIILQMFFYKDSRIYFRNYKEKPRWIFYGFLLITALHGILTLTAVFHPEERDLFQGLGALLYTLWTLFLFFNCGQSEKGSFERAGLQLGNMKIGIRFIVGIIIFFLVQAAFNLLFNLGDFVGQPERIYGLPIPSLLYIPALIILFIFVTVIGTPLSGLAGVFGEEYGWRGFLQSEMTKTARLRGVIVIGVIWGIWHFPVILRGMHTYPSSVFGLFLAIIFFVLWGVIQGYAVIKTGSIWVAAFMHGVVNSVYSFSLTYITRPENKVYSFGLGIYGLICLGIIVYVIIRDSVWKLEVNENGK